MDLNQQTEVTVRLYTITLPHHKKGAVTALLTSHMLSEFLSTGPEPTEKTPTITGEIMQFSWLVILFTVAFLAHTLEESATTPG